MDKTPQIKVSKEFFINANLLILSLENIDLSNLGSVGQQAMSSLRKEIDAKYESMKRRESFTKYKKSEGEEREKHRQEYLERTEIHPNWRSKAETHSDERN